jgi:hypothetical protein
MVVYTLRFAAQTSAMFRILEQYRVQLGMTVGAELHGLVHPAFGGEFQLLHLRMAFIPWGQFVAQRRLVK